MSPLPPDRSGQGWEEGRFLLDLALRLEEGRGGPADPGQAFACYELAAAAGGPARAHEALGRCHRDGLGTVRDLHRAVHHFILAASRGSLRAEEALADLFRAGPGPGEGFLRVTATPACRAWRLHLRDEDRPTGASWKVVALDGALVARVGQSFQPDGADPMGPGVQELAFRARAFGPGPRTTALALAYGRSWALAADPPRLSALVTLLP